MKNNLTDNLDYAHKLNHPRQDQYANRIPLYAPTTVYDALIKLESNLKNYPASKSSLLKTVVPTWGGPNPNAGRHVSCEALSFLKKVPFSELNNAPHAQLEHFKKCNATSSYRRRHRHYLKSIIKACVEQGWIAPEENIKKPKFNQLNSPKGCRRIEASDVRITNLTQPKPYSFGKLEHHFVEIDGKKILGNSNIDFQLEELRKYLIPILKYSELDNKSPINLVKCILGYLHDIKGVPLADLSLTNLVPFIQLKYSEEDFTSHPAFERDTHGNLVNPLEAEQVLAISEALAQRRAKEMAQATLKTLESFFAWRQEELAKCGKPEGYEPSSKRAYLLATILVAEFLYQGETDYKRLKVKSKNFSSTGFDDIPAIIKLRREYRNHPIDKTKIKRRIYKNRCIPWLDAIKIFEKQRQKALIFEVTSRSSRVKSGFLSQSRKLTGIASEIQKTTILGLCLFIPTDRQQTYRNLEFGKTLKNGYFKDSDFEEFVDCGIPEKPDEARYWVNLEDYKTVESYGEFWYPIPNIQFIDGTTFYQLISAWLWGFNDSEEKWPNCYKGDNKLWQGFIDSKGNRQGWRDALKPKHGFMLTMPRAKTQFDDRAFYSLVRSIFVYFTQEKGHPIPVSPHSLRHMLSKYLDELEINDEEHRSFSYVLHHSPETNKEKYVYREKMMRIAPAVNRMQSILENCMIK